MKLKKENVWEYPRPPICQPHNGIIKVFVGNKLLASTKSAFRVIETSHPPTYYIPSTDIDLSLLKKNKNVSFCEWKGFASYFDLSIKNENNIISNIGWSYTNPTKNFLPIKDFLSFYSSKVFRCIVNDEVVKKQEGDFYGGWITSNLKGPFKGGPGTQGW